MNKPVNILQSYLYELERARCGIIRNITNSIVGYNTTIEQFVEWLRLKTYFETKIEAVNRCINMLEGVTPL